MSMTFPSSPTVGQQYSVSGGPTYTWDGSVWKVLTPGQQYSPTIFTATAGQTTFTISGGYVIGAIDVFKNGVKLVNGQDYTATDLSTVVLSAACSAGDSVEIITLAQILYSQALKKTGDTMSGDLTVPNLAYTGTLTGGTGVIAIGTTQIYKDASGNVGIGTSSPTNKLVVSNSGAAGIEFGPVNGDIFTYNRSTSAYTDMILTANSISLRANGGSSTLKLDSSGNLGLGVTPTSGLNGNLRYIELGPGIKGASFAGFASSTNLQTWVSNNTYYDGASDKYAVTGSPAAMFRCANGIFDWRSTGSTTGTAGASSTLNTLMTLNANGSLILAGGNTAASGVGIAFPATQSASSDANTLDDYEEGTFTPTVGGSVTPGTGTYTGNGQTGRYTKIGNRCYYQIWLNWTNLVGTSGSLIVYGLPFSSASTTGSYNCSTIYMDSSLTLGASSVLQAYINISSSYIYLSQYSSGGAGVSAVSIDTVASIMINGFYEVA